MFLTFLVFTGQDYYPGCGFNDFRGAYDSYDEAMAAVPKHITERHDNWWQIVQIDHDRNVVILAEGGS